MELVKNIFFNTDKLTPNTKVKISYTGKFFQDGSTNVYIHYGFGNSWDNLVDGEMVKTELGFQIEVDLLDKDTFNFCLKNEKNEWDNNNNHNYIFLIEHPEASLVLLEDFDVPTIRRLRKSYIISKKVKLAIYKMLIYVPRLISGNYKKKRKADTNV
jgi:hypothetical protein